MRGRHTKSQPSHGAMAVMEPVQSQWEQPLNWPCGVQVVGVSLRGRNRGFPPSPPTCWPPERRKEAPVSVGLQFQRVGGSLCWAK